MGNQHANKNEKSLFTTEELRVLDASYKAIAGHLEKLSQDRIQQNWSTFIDPDLARVTIHYLLHQSPSSITFKRFTEPYYIVEQGTIEEKGKFIAACLETTDASTFAIRDLENYVAYVLRSYIAMITHSGSDVYKNWKVDGSQSNERTVVPFAKSFTRSLSLDGVPRIELYKLESWVNQNPTFVVLWQKVFSYMYSRNAGKNAKLGRESSLHILPAIVGLKKNYSPVLDIPHVIFLNSNLPNEFRHKWRFLFSSKTMGESFSTMLGTIIQKGPTLLIVEDEDRYIFAGYAPSSWALSPVFMGNDTSMLFTLSPALRCFSATGYNDHYQYLNLNQQTMPNGLGMGGQHNYWGLWIDSDFGLGHSSESCTTYRDYVQLSKRKEFRIRNMEVFAVGDEPTRDEDDDPRKPSILDRNLEDRVILELSGKEVHSEGLREPDKDL